MQPPRLYCQRGCFQFMPQTSSEMSDGEENIISKNIYILGRAEGRIAIEEIVVLE